MNRQKELENIRQKSIESWASAQKKALHENVKNTPVAPPATAAGTGTGAGGSFNNNTVYYLRWSEGEPWAEEGNLNPDQMDAVFGVNGWTLGYFDTIDVAEVFKKETTYIFMDGSDGSSIDFYTFYYNNYGFISDWVFNGGRLFVNAAPNVGGNMNLGFGGMVLNFSDAETDNTLIDSVIITEGSETHPIFNGPGSTGTAWTGDSFAHAFISGNATGLIEAVDLITSPPAQVLVELEWGSGLVMLGGMTITHFQDPKPESIYLRQNIHAYMGQVSYTPGFLLMATPFAAFAEPASSRRF